MDSSLISPEVLRSRAEKQLAAQKAWLAPDGEADHLKLIHELQVHQIELEMQNGMLAEAFAHVNALRAKYQDLYESAPAGYFTLSVDGKILELNGRAARLLGQSPRDLMGRSLREFFSETCLAAADKLLAAAREGGESGESGEEVFAPSLEIRRNRQLPLYVNAQARMYKDPLTEEAGIRLVMMDVSTLKMATEDVIHAMEQASGWGGL
jgi:PAS domain S-box-containing protein